MADRTRLFLTRHGETEWNDRGLVQGQVDVSLSERGIEQAKHLADRLATERIDHIYCSDLKRARRTAEIVGDPHGLDPVPDPSLAEQDFGEWDGAELDDLYGMLERTGTEWTEWSPENGESWTAFAERVLGALERVVFSHRGERVLISAHGGVNKVILTYTKFSDISQRDAIKQGNACLNEITYAGSGTYDVHAINDDAHLL